MSHTLCLRCRAALRNSTQSHSRLLCPQQQRAYQSNKDSIIRRVFVSQEEYQSSPGSYTRAPPLEVPSPEQTISPTSDVAGTITHKKTGFRRIRKIKTIPAKEQDTFRDPIDAILEKPTWSVRSLLPSPGDNVKQAPTVSSAQLRHLLRLSALPAPSSPEEEANMLRTLESQLHFVREIQSVDTTGVQPLQAIRDETEEGIREITIGLEALKDALGKETLVGRHKRPRRRGNEEDGDISGEKKAAKSINPAENWDVMGMAEKKVGQYFVVDSSGVGTVENKVDAS